MEQLELEALKADAPRIDENCEVPSEAVSDRKTQQSQKVDLELALKKRTHYLGQVDCHHDCFQNLGCLVL